MYKIIFTLLKNRGEIRKEESIIKHVRKYNLMLYTFMHDASFIILYKITIHFLINYQVSITIEICYLQIIEKILNI